MKWLKGWFDATDATKDVKILAFASVVVFSIYKLARSPINPDWNTAYSSLCLLVGLGGSAWAAVDRWKGGSNERPPEKTE